MMSIKVVVDDNPQTGLPDHLGNNCQVIWYTSSGRLWSVLVPYSELNIPAYNALNGPVKYRRRRTY